VIPAHAPASAIFDAIAPCAPTVAGNLFSYRPGALDAMTSHNVGMPEDIVDMFMRAPPEHVAHALSSMVTSRPGTMSRVVEAIPGPMRAEIQAIRDLERFGLGEGAGYKVLERSAPGGDVEHVLLVLLSARGEDFTERHKRMLAELTPAVQAAVLRTELPLVAHESLFAQIVAEQTLGYVCLSASGTVLESNRRAHELASRYHTHAGILGQRHALADLAQRARERGPGAGAWRVPGRDGVSMVEIHVHRLAHETHAVSEDVFLVMMREWPALPSLDLLDALAALTPRQRQIAFLLARHGLAYKEIAQALGVSEGTVRTHAERIYRLVGVHSRAELARLLRG
jgi:DNA-binding CsgD family transcriptional regulator